MKKKYPTNGSYWRKHLRKPRKRRVNKATRKQLKNPRVLAPARSGGYK